MCGIAASFSYNARLEPDEEAYVGAVCDHMQARGPDGAGVFVNADAGIVMGHRRLAIIDLSDRGRQPMHSVDGRLVVTFNGEIYNYRSLRTQLERDGAVFYTESDTEVLLHLYQRFGEEMVEHLRGMYAFVLWDAHREGVLLARDPYGIKPLYIADDGKTMRVASQVKALLATGRVDTAAEPAGHVGYFLWGHVPEPYTLYRGVRALPAGHTLWVDRQGQRRLRTYADLTDLLRHASHVVPGEGGDGATGTPYEELGEALRDSVRHHLVADVDVGVFLSAGMDSATLLALAAEEQTRLQTITLSFREFQGTLHDEGTLAAEVAQRYGAEHRVHIISQEDFLQDYNRLFAAMDQPSSDGVNSYFVAQAAARSGLKVALSGLGGDELFGGYPSFQELPRLVRTMRGLPIGASMGRGFRVVAGPLLSRLTSPKYAGVFEYGHTYGGAYLLRRGFYMPWELPGLLGTDMASAGWNELQTTGRLAATVDGIRSERLRVTALESVWYMRNQLLRDTDWASMAHSLEIRVPLVDWDLLRRVAPLVAQYPGINKRVMARSPRRALPPSVLTRLKTGFSIPVRNWLLESKPLTPYRHERGLRGWARHVYDQFATGGGRAL